MAYEQESPLINGTSNDTLASADLLAPESRMVASLSSSSDQDFFVLNTSGAALITLDFTSALLATSNKNWQIRLLDGNGDYLQTLTGSVTGTPLVNGASQTGTTLAIDGLTGTAPAVGSKFTFVTASADTTVYTVVDATKLAGGGTTLTLDRNLPVGLADNTAIAFDPAQVLTGLSTTLSAAVGAAGNYYVQVLADGVVYNASDYGLTAHVTLTTEKEGNDTRLDAVQVNNRLLANTPMSGALSSGADVDYWVFTTAKPSDFKLAFSSASTSTNPAWSIDVTQWSGAPVQGGALTAGASSSVSVSAADYPGATTFLVKVAATSTAAVDTGNYTLKVSGSSLDLNDPPVLSVGSVSSTVPNLPVETQVTRNIAAGNTEGVRLDSLFSVSDPDIGQSVTYYRFSLTKASALVSDASIRIGAGTTDDPYAYYGFGAPSGSTANSSGNVTLTAAQMATALFLPGTTAADSVLSLALQAYDSTSTASDLGGPDDSGSSAILIQTLKIVSAGIGVVLDTLGTTPTLSENALGEGSAKPHMTSFTVALSQAPSSDVKVYLTDVNDQLDFQAGGLATSVLTFNALNYAFAQTVTVVATADGKAEGASQTAGLSFQVVSLDSNYDGAVVRPLAFTVSDNAAPALVAPAAIVYTDTDAADSFTSATSGAVSGTLSAPDANGDTVSFGITGGIEAGATVSKSSALGTLTVTKATGAYSFAPDAAAMNATSSRTSVDFVLTASDGTVTATSNLSVSVVGVNDKPIVNVGTPSAALLESGGAANAVAGNANSTVLLSLSDAEGGASIDTGGLTTLGWATANSGSTYTKTGTYGTATLTISTGQVAYHLDDADADTQALKATDAVKDIFSVPVHDPAGATAMAKVDFSIGGANDFLILKFLADQVASVGSALSFDLHDRVVDVDGPSLTVTATTADGETLPAWLSFDAAHLSFSGTPASTDLGTVSVLVTASDGESAASDSFDIVVNDVNSAPTSDVTISGMAYSWRAHTLLDGVNISGASQSVTTNASGAASFTTASAPSLSLAVNRVVPAAEASATSSAVNLQDAIAILKMIVGLDVNGAGKPLSPYQSLAADFDGNGTVGLTDAIGVLKHVVGLTAPDPTWHFLSEVDPNVPAITALSPGVPQTTVTADLTGASPAHVGLVGYLSGDVDGSYAGAAGAQDLDATQSGYFVSLVAQHPDLTLSQFGL